MNHTPLTRFTRGRSLRWLLFLGLTSGSCTLPAQDYVPLVEFASEWRYDQSGAELGTAWRTNGFNDSTWPVGQGLLGVEDNIPYPYPVPIRTLLELGLPGMPRVITYYFRTGFCFPASNFVPGLMLRATNLVDDGCVIYLNGMEAGRLRVPAGQTSRTYGGASTNEGIFEPLILNANLLRAGTNVLAVEVHQLSTNSSDVMLGVHLTAIVPRPPLITNQPQSLIVPEGSPVTLSVGAEGGPLSYQWRRNGVNLGNGVTSTLVYASASAALAGVYTVIVSNQLGAVQSAPATVTVVPDRFGPRILSARVEEAGFTNSIIVALSEPSDIRALTNRTNCVVRRMDTGASAAVSSAVLQNLTNLVLTVGGPNWMPQAAQYGYFLTLNRVRDLHSNVIAPDSQVALSFVRRTGLIAPQDVWSYHATLNTDPTVLADPWTQPEFVESILWTQGGGVFRNERFVSVSPCFVFFQTDPGFFYYPTLFRKRFVWSGQSDPSPILTLNVQVDDGVVVYLNGETIYQYNAQNPPVTVGREAVTEGNSISCASLQILATHLRPGTNCLAAAVFQYPAALLDDIFGLSLQAAQTFSRPLPASPPPTLSLTRTTPDSAVISWNAAGYALEEAPRLDGGVSAPWLEVPNMSNPYPIVLSPATNRFFRLRK